MSEFEFDAEKTCARCEGDGGWESPTGHHNHVTGALITQWRECGACEGKGTHTIHVRPIDMEDLFQDEDPDPYCAFAYRGGNP